MPEPPKPRLTLTGVEKPEDDVVARGDRQRDRLAERRTATLNGIGVKPSPPIPPAPELPFEHQPTVRAPEAWDRKATRQRPPPPSAMRRATPSPLPAAPRPGAWSNGYEAQGQTGDGPASEPPSASPLPPPSRSPQEAADAAKDRELARLRRERDEARAKLEQSASIVPDGSLESLRKAQTKLYLGIAAALVALAVPLGAYLTAAAEANRARSERAATQAGNAVNAADSAKQSASNADKEIAALRTELRQYRANMREVLRLQGIDTAKRAGDPDPNDLDPVVPFCPRGKVCPGPQLQLRNAP